MSITQALDANKKGFGTAPVFVATISTILGAILFLRFGYAVAHVGFWGTMGIIALGHVVTIATAMAVAEIATNQDVEEGGAYFIISRSFGLNVGAAVGIALYAAQAISIAFYVIAFAESFESVIPWLQNKYPFLAEFSLFQIKQLIGLITMSLLALLILLKGANVGVQALYVVAGVLAVSIVMFLAGSSDYVPSADRFTETVANPDSFFYVFTIIFPAFTGVAAGLGLSGDLKNPRRAIPLGTLSAVLVGMVIYIIIAYKLTMSASSEDLANDQLYMAQIAVWGPIIPIGLACAAVSSALGSILVAPRTLQALAMDKALMSSKLNSTFAKVRKKDNEPINSAVLTCIIAFIFVGMGSINSVAEVISMFFMLTYGAICLISFLEHFIDDPYYRPTFRSKWYLSLIGAIACFWLMFQMNFLYAAISVALMLLIYFLSSRFGVEKVQFANVAKDAMAQLSWRTQIMLQKAELERGNINQKPSVICISKDSFKRKAVFDILRWMSFKHGFGTYIHLVQGYLNEENHQKAMDAERKMVKLADKVAGNVYITSLISPSYTSAIAQAMQLPGASGRKNNTVLFEFPKRKPDVLQDVLDNYDLMASLNFNMAILGSSERGFGYRRKMHLWLTGNDQKNVSSMILFAFVILGHPEWSEAKIEIYMALTKDEKELRLKNYLQQIKEDKSPIQRRHLRVITIQGEADLKPLINEHSINADLVMLGATKRELKTNGLAMFEGYDDVGNMFFVCAMGN